MSDRLYRLAEQTGFRFLNILLVCRSQMALEAVKESVTNEVLSLGKCDQLLDVTEGVSSCQTLPKV